MSIYSICDSGVGTNISLGGSGRKEVGANRKSGCMKTLGRKQDKLDKLVRKAGSVVGTEMDSAECRTLNGLLSIMDNP